MRHLLYSAHTVYISTAGLAQHFKDASLLLLLAPIFPSSPSWIVKDFVCPLCVQYGAPTEGVGCLCDSHMSHVPPVGGDMWGSPQVYTSVCCSVCCVCVCA